MFRAFATPALFALALGFAASIETFAEEAPDLNALIARVVARDAATQKELDAMQYRQDSKTEQFDDSGHVTHQQQAQMIIRPGATQEIQVVSVKGDQIPSDPDEAVQQAHGQETERRKHNFSLKNLVTRFNISWVGRGDFMGQQADIIAFEPKPDQPFHDQTEKVLNQLHGRMWIGRRNGVVLKTEASLAQPVSVAWFFAKITKLDFDYELRSATSNFGPAWIQLAVEVDTPILNFHQRQTVDMTHFEPRRQIAAVKSL